MDDNDSRVETRWPPGFTANPLRLVRRSQSWKAGLWSLALAITAIPLLVVSLLLLPWLPLIGRTVDFFACSAARWMGESFTRRSPRKWFDWPQFVNLIFQILLSIIAFCITMAFFVPFVLLLVIPFFTFSESDPRFNIGPLVITNPVLIFPASWSLALVFLLVFLYLAWAVSSASVYSVFTTNTANREELAHLERSRVVLLDAFTGERSRIERELHDGVQQYLTALKLNVATAELLASKQTTNTTDTDPRLHDALKEANHNAHRALESLRSTVRGIYPQVLQDKGLAGALQELIAHSGITGVLKEKFSGGRDAQLSATSALLLYHCAAEGLTNAVHHGSAGQVAISLHYSPHEVSMRIDDDGCGPGQFTKEGTGISGLRERASALGGTVKFDLSPDFPGARMQMTLPRSLNSKEPRS